MSKNIILFSLFVFILALSGCSQKTKSFLGLSKTAPDEFTIIPNQPLIIPPMFDLPEPDTEKGLKKPQQEKEGKKALSAEDKNFMKQFNKTITPSSK